VQLARFADGETSAPTNAHLGQKDLRRVCALDEEGARVLAQAVDRYGLSARAYGKVLRVARTIADLEGATAIARPHVTQAVAGRILDRDVIAPDAAA
jgi:magnesium chelatase family protein